MKAPPKHTLQVISVLSGAGFEAFYVGGCVRDAILGRKPNDWDIASSALPEDVMGLFPRTIPTGIRHGTVTVLRGGKQIEITSFRTEGRYSDHRRPDSVIFTDNLTADLSRRDFTMNAMAMDEHLSIIDPFGGQADIKAGIIRCVHDPLERFAEDALRMLRALRFSAQLGFVIEPETFSALQKCAPLCRALSPERVRDELCKTLRSKGPDVVYDMVEYGLLDSFVSRDKPPTRLSLTRLPQYARLSHLCLALEGSGNIMSTAFFLRALRFDSRSVQTSSAAVDILRSGSRDWKRILRDHGEGAAKAAYPHSKRLRAVLRSGECWKLSDLAVNGRHLAELGISGRETGVMLGKLLEHVIDRPQDNDLNILCKQIREGYYD